ncbi:MAG: DUF523 domain-containing protein [bacterium]
MVKILVSSCLLGDNCKYNGGNNYCDIESKLSNYEIIKFCPEVSGGLSIPRTPAEIVNDKVITSSGDDVTNEFTLGAIRCLELCKKHNIKKAILKEKSPSCGVNSIYDGTFSNTLIDGLGITTKLLKENGIEVISDIEFLK